MSHHRHYCHDASCAGALGFDVRWYAATMTCPAEPERDSCPHCGLEMHDQGLPFEDAAAELLDTLGVPPPPGDATEFARQLVANTQRFIKDWNERQQRRAP